MYIYNLVVLESFQTSIHLLLDYTVTIKNSLPPYTNPNGYYVSKKPGLNAVLKISEVNK